VQTPGGSDFIDFEEDAGRPGEMGGIAHFGFRLKDAGDIDRAASLVERAGGKILERGEFLPGEPYLFFSDPDGYVVEVWYEPTRRRTHVSSVAPVRAQRRIVSGRARRVPR
jgi:catechol 2,3-dioxygenase-like lactoylglutathione lyase family enzyme